MARPLLFTILFLPLSAITVKGQHCPFDNTAIIVVTVHEKDSSKNIPNLRITFVDSLGNPVTKTRYKNGKAVVDTLRFWQNPAKTTFQGRIDNENPSTDSKICFPFAKDNYVFTCSHDFPNTPDKIFSNNYRPKPKKYFIKIEEIDGKENGEYYPLHWPVPLYEQDKYSLCGTFNDTEYSPVHYGGRIYKPIDIIMQRKK